MEWRKAKCTGGECIEVADSGDGTVRIRDGKEPLGPMLVMPRAAFAELVEGAKAGAFDHMT